MSTCDHICRECGGVMNCQHCKPYRLPADRARIAELEAALRRAIHLVETITPLVMWPIDNEDELYTDEWARLSLEMVRETLAKSAS